MSHRRWRRESTGYGDYVDEHNSLFDAYEAERQRADAAEKEVAEHRRHVSIQMSREAKARRELREFEKRVQELESRSIVPPGVPSVETLYELYKGTCNTSSCNKDWPHGRRKAAIAAVRDAILAALPVLTREEVEARWDDRDEDAVDFARWVYSRIPARLEPVAVTEEEIEEALRREGDEMSNSGWAGSAKAVMSLLREKQVVEEPEPIATAETPTTTLHETPLELDLNGDRLKFKDGRIELSKAPNNHTWILGTELDPDSAKQAGRWLLSYAGASVPEAEPIATAETLEQLAEIGMAEVKEFWFVNHKWNDLCPHYQQDFIRFITAILRAARPEIDLRSASAWRSGESVLHAADLPSLNPYIRYRVGLPPDDFFLRDEMRERQITLYQQWLLAYAHRGWVPKGAHEQALNAALSLPEYMAELNAALDAKGGE